LNTVNYETTPIGYYQLLSETGDDGYDFYKDDDLELALGIRVKLNK